MGYRTEDLGAGVTQDAGEAFLVLVTQNTFMQPWIKSCINNRKHSVSEERRF